MNTLNKLIKDMEDAINAYSKTLQLFPSIEPHDYDNQYMDEHSVARTKQTRINKKLPF